MRIFNAFQTDSTNTTRASHKKKTAQKSEAAPVIRDERIIQHAPPSVNERDVRDKLARAKQKNIVMTEPKKVENYIPAHPESLEAQKKVETPSKKVAAPQASTVNENPSEPVKKEQEVNDEILLKSDIAKNDPKDPRVQEKLKDALQNGAFKFNDKEREVLAKILGN